MWAGKPDRTNLFLSSKKIMGHLKEIAGHWDPEGREYSLDVCLQLCGLGNMAVYESLGGETMRFIQFLNISLSLSLSEQLNHFPASHLDLGICPKGSHNSVLLNIPHSPPCSVVSHRLPDSRNIKWLIETLRSHAGSDITWDESLPRILPSHHWLFFP